MPERLDEEARRKLAESLRSPERGAKIAAAQRGKQRPADVVAKMRRARKSVRHSAAARAKMRASHDALGARRIPDPTTAGDFCRRFRGSALDRRGGIAEEIREREVISPSEGYGTRSGMEISFFTHKAKKPARPAGCLDFWLSAKFLIGNAAPQKVTR